MTLPLDPETLDELETGGRPRDCNRGGGRNNSTLTLIELLADIDSIARKSARRDEWRILDPDVIEAMSLRLRHSRPSVTVMELQQMARRRAINLTSLGDGQYAYEITEYGISLWLGE